MTRKLILVVIDGLTPEVFEQAVERKSAPTLASLHDAGTYGRAVLMTTRAVSRVLRPVAAPLSRSTVLRTVLSWHAASRPICAA